MRNKFTVLALVASLALTGCANMTQTERDTATGAGIGAAAGAIIGHQSGHTAGGAVIGGILGAAAGHAWSSNMEQQRIAMERAVYGTGIIVTRTADNRLKLYIPSHISFRSGGAEISPSFSRILNRFAVSLNNYPYTTVAIVGHTDSTGSDAVNLSLSRDRATSTRDYLISRGVAPDRFWVDGRSSYEPVASNATANGRAKNRRVEIYISERVR
jgi:outer membrane protein OmpA-like peptidoglycan-associated protein